MPQGAERNLAERAERLRAERVPVETAIRTGAPLDAVIDVAEAGAIQRVILGSVITRLLHVLRRPLLVVP